MKELIKKALELAWIKASSNVPKKIKKEKKVDISNIYPKDLGEFMEKNNIPPYADFDGEDNGYDGWSVGKIFLSWDIEVSPSKKYMDEKRIYFFNKYRSWEFVRDALIKNGYKRYSQSPDLLKIKEFKSFSIYDAFVNEEYDKLEKYYSLFFH